MQYYSLWKTHDSIKIGIIRGNNMLYIVQTIVWECVYLGETVSTALKQCVIEKG